MGTIKKIILSLTILVVSCTDNKKPLFTQVSHNKTKITFENKLSSAPKLNILNYIYYYNGAGAAAADFNNDGLDDLYFTANETEDALYLNQGALSFKNITKETGIKNDIPWTTGVTTVDINNDGLMDIYICKVSGIQNLTGHNLLYVNQGSSNGIPQFKEESANYGLDFSGLATQSTFFDYDQDGDLDMYLMNHSVHPNLNYGKGSQRLIPDAHSGDRLYENRNGHFVDVTQQSGIFQGKIGYGLGLSVSDINNDNLPDLYIGNDFFENDYLYLNNGDKTFTERISSDINALGHTTHFSMGNAIADYNNDGLTDIFSLDMLPENLETYKASGTEYSYPTYQNYLNNGYSPQYMQNTLHLNMGSSTFSEIGSLANIPATEWSWGITLADFDNDGHKDAYISNGIKGASNDMDFINFIANDNIQKNLGNGIDAKEMEFIAKMPEKHVSNYFFKNKGDLTFQNVSETWSNPVNSFSNGTIYSDLDNDGDLDIVVNNVNEKAFVLENHSNENPTNRYINIRFKGPDSNTMGIGAKVFAYSNNTVQVFENFTTQGYLSSVAPKIHLGLGSATILDSLKVQWPDNKTEVRTNVAANQSLLFDYADAKDLGIQRNRTPRITSNTNPFPFKHQDGNSVEFYRDPLIPYANTNEGPSLSTADVNLDGLQDVFVGGAKQQASKLFLQEVDGSFTATQSELFAQDKVSEDVSHLFFDANSDDYVDLLVVSGGNEFKGEKPLNPRLYINRSGVFEKDTVQFNDSFINASRVKAWDMENDGDVDLIITSNATDLEFGKTPKQYLFENNGLGTFTDVTKTYAPQLQTLGNVTDVLIEDFDGDGYKDVLFAGHWMPLTLFMNNGKSLQLFKNNGLDSSHGLWNVIKGADVDNDGDIDLIAGNWGLNSKLTATTTSPLTLYKADIDANGTQETIVTYVYKGTETVLASKDELSKQIPVLNKKFLSYSDFAKASVDELFTRQKLSNGTQKKVYELASCSFENLGNGNFKKIPLPTIAQISNVKDILIEKDETRTKVIIVGNNFEISTQLGRMDASHGIILYPSDENPFTEATHSYLGASGAARTITPIQIKDTKGYLLSRNNDSLLFIPKEHKN